MDKCDTCPKPNPKLFDYFAFSAEKRTHVFLFLSSVAPFEIPDSIRPKHMYFEVALDILNGSICVCVCFFFSVVIDPIEMCNYPSLLHKMLEIIQKERKSLR